MEMSTAFNLLLVGMVTVFVVLLLVFATGNLLIRFVNSLGDDDSSGKQTGEISNQKVAVLNAAVEAFTEGKGRISGIEKIK